MHRYTANQIAFIRSNAEGNTREAICDLFNAEFGTSLELGSIRSIMSRNGIKNRLQGHATRFVKGSEPWNKNMKGLQLGGEETWYQKGNLPSTHRSVGSESVIGDYIVLKIADPDVWVTKHRYIWEREHGDIPIDCVILFKDGDKNNVQLENLFMTKRIAMTSVAKRKLRTDHAVLNEPIHILAELELKIKTRRNRNENTNTESPTTAEDPRTIQGRTQTTGTLASE